MNVTFEDGMQESLLPMFEMKVDEDGYVYFEDGSVVPTYNGHEPLHVDEIGGFVKHPRTGEDMLLRDNFCDMCDYVRESEEVGDITRFLK